jgi:hypothetical protein
MLSLLDLAGRDPCRGSWSSWIARTRWWNALLKPGYQHVQLWRPVQYGPQNDEKFWLVVDPGLEHVDTKNDWTPQPPWEREAVMRR